MHWVTNHVIGLDYWGRPIYANAEKEMKEQEKNNVIRIFEPEAELSERLQKAERASPATYAVLLATLTSHPDFEGIYKVWICPADGDETYGWVIALQVYGYPRHETPSQPSITEAVLKALEYLETHKPRKGP